MNFKAAISIVFVLATGSAVALDQKVINIVAPEFWCPFACKADTEREGFAVEIAKAALKQQGIQVKYTNMPYDRALLEVKNGKAVQAVLPTFKAEAPSFIYPLHPTSATEYCFYVKNESKWRFEQDKELALIRFTATSGYSYEPRLDKFIKQSVQQGSDKVHLFKGQNIPARMYKMVMNNRYDAFLEDTRLIQYLLASKGIQSGIKKAGCLDTINYGYLALTPNNDFPSKKYADAFDRGMLSLRKNGKLKYILSKYGVDDWE
jgi:polar amino acid transport system substrate-binding protein